MNSYFEAQSGFYGQTPGAPGGDYRFPIGLGGLSSMSPYGQHQPRPPQSDTSYDTPASPSKASSLYSSLTDSAAYRYVVVVEIVRFEAFRSYQEIDTKLDMDFESILAKNLVSVS